jgi:hypothetical protein
MADDASGVLGAPEIAGVAGNLAAGLATGPAYAGAQDVPDFGRVAYVAASADEIAIVKTKSGMLKMKISNEVLVRVPRSEIAAAELDEGRLLSHLKLAFGNGVTWEFDIPKANKKSAQALVRALN